MLLKSFCGVMSLTAGMVILGFCCLMGAFIALVSNLHYLVHFETGMIFVVVFILILSVAGTLMITAAFKENRNIALLASVMIILALLIFVVGSVISLANQSSMLEYVCVHKQRRCPETMWGASLEFRTGATSNHTRGDVKGRVHTLITPIPHVRQRRDNTDDTDPEHDLTDPLATDTEQTTKYDIIGTTAITTEDDEYDYHSTKEPYGNDEGEPGYKIGPQLIAAAVVCAIHFIFLVFSALIAFSYYQELHYFTKLHMN